ncbi:MAG: DUF6701 domain-containing protein [Pseudomonadota bacterium]
MVSPTCVLEIDEDQNTDSDRSHTTERVGVLAISSSFHGTQDSKDMEAGSVAIAGTSNTVDWTSVSFPNAFNDVPRIFALPTNQGTLPAALRVRDVTTTGFDIAAVQPPGGTGGHPEMEIDYVAVIPGEHQLANGDVFEVGSIDTALFQDGFSSSTGTTQVNFATSFSSAPAVLLQIQDINNESGLNPSAVSSPWLVTAVTAVSSSQMTLALDRAEASSGSVSVAETIAYFAVEDGSNEQLSATDNSTVDYEMFVTPDNILGWDDGCFDNNFTDTYTTPYAIATDNSRDGSNGGWVRRCDLQSNSIGLLIDEDQSNDSERSHTTEIASVFVFSKAFEAEFSTLDHFAIFHAGSGVTCEAEAITISAQDASDIAVEAGGTTIRVTATSSTGGWSANDTGWSLQTGAGTFSTPSTGVAQYQFDTGESSVVLLLSNISEADIDIDVVDINNTSITDREGTAQDPLLSFTNTGFRFYADADADGDNDGSAIGTPQIAGQSSAQMILRAVETDTLTGSCIARLSGSQNIDMAYECIDPSTCVRNNDMNINSTAIAENDAGSVSNFLPVSLTFDADGEAPFNLTYFDVGSVRLHAQIDVAASGGEPAITLSGTSDTTTAQPADIVLTTIETSGGTANPGTTTSGAGFVTAGTPFRVVAEVRHAGGGLTPNFGNELSPEQIALSIDSLVMPAGGISPALDNASAFSSTGTGGEFENVTVNWDEVGTITLQASVADNDYLGTGSINGTASGNVGRFYPSHFTLTSSTVSADCASFSYMSDQSFSHTPLSVNYAVTAENVGLSRTQNYDSSLSYPVDAFLAVAENNNDGTNLGSRLSVPTADWVAGENTLSGSDNSGFRRGLNSGVEQPDGPYTSLQLGIRVAGSGADSIEFLSSDLDLNASTSGDCSSGSTCNAVALGSSVSLIFGRIFAKDAHGPETAALAVPLTIQQWNGSTFVDHENDSCTRIGMSTVRFDGNSLSSDASRTVAVGSSTSTGSFSSFTPAVDFGYVSGDAGLSFSAPGAGNTGQISIDIDLSTLPWLRSDWNNDGDYANDTSVPTFNVNFGNYRGHDRIIHWQEIFQ